MQYLGALGYSDEIPIRNFLPVKEDNQQEVERVLSSEEVGALHKNVEAHLKNTDKGGDRELFLLSVDMDALLKAALWEDKFNEIWSKSAPTGISFSSEEEKKQVKADIPRVLQGAEPSNEYSESFCDELMKWCEAYFQIYCGKDYENRNYPQWFTLRYRKG